MGVASFFAGIGGFNLGFEASDLWCAGWPCQDISNANTERQGLAGERSGLFFTFMALVREVQPAWLVMENVPG